MIEHYKWLDEYESCAENTLGDITAVYYTSNRMPQDVAERIREVNGYVLEKLSIPLVSVSQKPIEYGENICIGDIGVNVLSLYRQIMIGAAAARTKYIACIEDDALYCPAHFTDCRPPSDTFAYDMRKWGVYVWHKEPVYSFKHRTCMWTCIAPRDLLIEALSERFASPKACASPRFGEPGRYEKNLGVKVQKMMEFFAGGPDDSSVVFSHLHALGAECLGRRKRVGDNIHTKIARWGDAKELTKYYWGEEEWRSQVG